MVLSLVNLPHNKLTDILFTRDDSLDLDSPQAVAFDKQSGSQEEDGCMQDLKMN